MAHAIEVELTADTGKYKQSIESARKATNDSASGISATLDKIKAYFGSTWDSISAALSGFGNKTSSAFSGLSDSATSAFSKIASYLPGFTKNMQDAGDAAEETDKKSDGVISKIGTGLVVAFAAAAVAVAAFTAKGLLVDSAFAKASIAGDIGAAALGKFEDAAKRSGLSIADLGTSVKVFQDKMREAAGGTGGEVFNKLGVSVKNSNNELLATDPTLIDFARHIAAMSSEAEKYDAAAKAGFGGKVQLLEDIAHASTLAASTSDDQAARVVQLGKIWHEVLPGGKTMWEDIGTALSNKLTPALITASTAVLENKNKILDAFNQIYGGGSMFDKLGDKIAGWATSLSGYFSNVVAKATSAGIAMAEYIGKATGLGNPLKTAPSGGYLPGQTQLASGQTSVITNPEMQKQIDAYNATSAAIKAQNDATREEIATGKSLTEARRAQIVLEAGVRDGTVKMTEAQYMNRLGELKNQDALQKAAAAAKDAQSTSEAAAKKEAEQYATVSAAIAGKIAENKLELLTGTATTEGQKLAIKIDADQASGKKALSAAHLEAAKAALAELDATEKQVLQAKAQKEVNKYIEDGTTARTASRNALEAEYQAYGKNADVLGQLMVAVNAETDMQKELDKLRQANLPISAQTIIQLEKERDARTAAGQATLGQSNALKYATQLADENKKFAADSILDEKDRAAALLAIDADMWQKRIELAGAGTEAQKDLQSQYNTWYANQLQKPFIEQQKAFIDTFEKTAHDTFVSIGNGGKDTWQRLKDSAKNMFFDWLYQMTLKKWVINIGASLSESVVGGIAGAAGGSSGSGAVGLISAGQKIYEGFSSGFAGTGTALGSAVSALGNIFGSSSVSAFGAGMGLTGSQATAAASAYSNAGMGSVGSSLSAGSTAGAAAGTFAGIAGGLIGGKLVSGGYGGNGAVNTGTAIGAALGTVVPVLGTALGAIVGGIIGGVYNRAFGYKDKEYSDNSTLAGTLSNGAFKGNLSTAYKQDGGWFRSDRSGTDTNAVGDTVASSLTTAYSAITSTSAAYAKALGLSADSIATRTQALSVTLGKDDAANQKVLTDFFTGVSDTIASELLPNIAQFSAAGETASVTLQRLVVDFQAVDILMSTLGVDSNKAFGATGAAAIAAREDLIALAGGLDNLSAQMKFISDNFITTAQKAAIAQTSVSTVMNAIGPALSTFGYSAIKTTDQYTNVVQGLASSGALATATGRQLYETLLALAPSFKLVTDEAANAKSAADQRASAAVDALGKAVDAQKNVVTNAYNAAMDALDARVTDLTDSISRMTALSTALKGSLSGVSAPGSAEASRASASAQINTALAIAKASGMLPSQDSIADALATLKSTSSDQFSSLADYQRSVAQSNVALEGLAGLTDSQVSAAQQQIDLLQQQKDQATAANTAQLAKLDNLVSAAQSQINAVNGINDSVLSVGQALLLVYEAANSLSGFSGIGATATPEGNNGGVGIFDMSAILLEMKTLNERIASMEKSAAATAKASGQFADQFNQVSGGGNSVLTVPA